MLNANKMKLCALLLGIILLAALQVWQQHARVSEKQVFEGYKKERSMLQQDVQTLRLELASLTRPDTLRRLAREKLGMDSPKPVQVMQQ